MAENRKKILLRSMIYLALLGGLAAVPLLGEPFYTRLASRILIYGLAALSLDLILGYGGMVSFGHAAFVGVGAYTVGILSFHGIESAWIAWPAAIFFSAVAGLFIGGISLRTSGVHFIMITLAFAQMLFYLFASLSEYGGDDGMALWSRNAFAFELSGNTAFFYVVLLILLVCFFVSNRLVGSRFGMVVQGARENERRMISLGFPVFRYKLACFVISAAMAGLAGALLANQSKYVSPALMQWTRSGEILVMVILGGMGTLVGPVLGAASLLLVEEILSSYTDHWMVVLGPLLIAVVLFGRGGIIGIFSGKKEV